MLIAGLTIIKNSMILHRDTEPKNMQYWLIQKPSSLSAVTIQMTRPILIRGRTIKINHTKPKKRMGAILVQHFDPFLQSTKINTSIAIKLMPQVHFMNLNYQSSPKSLSVPIRISTKKGIIKEEKRLISSLFAVNASVSGKHLVSGMVFS